MAEALNVSAMTLSEGGNDAAADMMEQLFWLDEEVPGIINLVRTQRSETRNNANQDFSLRYGNNFESPFAWFGPAHPPDL